jgi:hypothetical protein
MARAQVLDLFQVVSRLQNVLCAELRRRFELPPMSTTRWPSPVEVGGPSGREDDVLMYPWEGGAMSAVSELLGPFVGGRARLWDFSCSHSMLVVRLLRNEREEYLVCSAVKEMHVFNSWAITEPVITHLVNGEFELVDGGVRIRCEAFSVQEQYRRYRSESAPDV